MNTISIGIKTLFISLCLTSLIFISLMSTAVASDTYIMGWEDWAPFQFKGEGGKVTGLDIDLLTAIMEQGSMAVKFKEVPWKRHLVGVEEGTIHLAGGASKTPEREAFAYFSEPYRTESVVMYIRKGEAGNYAALKTLGQIKDMKFKLGVVNGYYYGANYDTLFKDKAFKAKTQQVNKNDLNIKKLVGGRIDACLVDPAVGTSILKELNMLDKVEVLPVEIYSDNIYVMFSKKSTDPANVEAFNKALKELKSNGNYDKILGNYIKK